MAGKAVLTAEEAAGIEAQIADRRAARDANPRPGRVGAYNQFWMDAGTQVLKTRQTSLVVDPPDGRVPARPKAEATRDYNRAHEGESYEYMSVWDRCISRGVPGSMFPAAYNNAYRFLQVHGYVVIVHEMIHDVRIIPVDGRSHVHPNITLWIGRLAGPLGRRHPGRGNDELQRSRVDRDERGIGSRQRPPGQRAAARRRAVHAGRRGHAQLRGHDHRSGGLRTSLDGGDADDAASGVHDGRARLPRRELGRDQHPQRCPG